MVRYRRLLFSATRAIIRSANPHSTYPIQHETRYAAANRFTSPRRNGCVYRRRNGECRPVGTLAQRRSQSCQSGRRPASGFNDAGSLDALVGKADIILSICPPHNAPQIAELLGLRGTMMPAPRCICLAHERRKSRCCSPVHHCERILSAIKLALLRH